MDLSSIQPFLDWLILHQQWVAVVIMGIAFLESLAIAGIFIPGVLLLFGASALAGSGILDVWTTLASALAGAVMGDCISFFLGKTMKGHIRSRWPFRKYPQWLNNGEAFFNHHGGKSIIIGRFVGPIRPVLPLVAGMLNMPSLRFVSINFLSAVAWAPLYILPGYLFGVSLQQDVTFPVGLGNLGLLLLLIGSLGFIFIRLAHWHLQPDSRLYRTIHAWIDRQHHARLFWHWLAERRGQQPPIFPLISMLLLLSSSIAFTLLWFLSTKSAVFNAGDQQVLTYFSSLHHPWLDQLFSNTVRIAERNCLLGISIIFTAWLLAKRHVAAALHIILALIGTELLVNGFQLYSSHADEIAPTFLFPSTHVTGITLVSGLLTSFIAQELSHHRRWWIYTAALLPVMLVSIAILYQGQQWLSGIVGGFLLGMAICGATRVSFSRYNSRPITADSWLWLSALITIVYVAIYLV